MASRGLLAVFFSSLTRSILVQALNLAISSHIRIPKLKISAAWS